MYTHKLPAGGRKTHLKLCGIPFLKLPGTGFKRPAHPMIALYSAQLLLAFRVSSPKLQKHTFSHLAMQIISALNALMSWALPSWIIQLHCWQFSSGNILRQIFFKATKIKLHKPTLYVSGSRRDSWNIHFVGVTKESVRPVRFLVILGLV